MDTPGTIVLFQVKYESKNWPASPVLLRTLIQLTDFSIFIKCRWNAAMRVAAWGYFSSGLTFFTEAGDSVCVRFMERFTRTALALNDHSCLS